VVLAAWGVLVVALVFKQLGAILQIDQDLLNLSPYTHVPQLPGQPFTWTPVVALCGVATALALCGIAGFRRRDLG
jgi:ABC-2 type transport system permease protein